MSLFPGSGDYALGGVTCLGSDPYIDGRNPDQHSIVSEGAVDHGVRSHLDVVSESYSPNNRCVRSDEAIVSNGRDLVFAASDRYTLMDSAIPADFGSIGNGDCAPVCNR